MSSWGGPGISRSRIAGSSLASPSHAEGNPCARSLLTPRKIALSPLISCYVNASREPCARAFMPRHGIIRPSHDNPGIRPQPPRRLRDGRPPFPVHPGGALPLRASPRAGGGEPRRGGRADGRPSILSPSLHGAGARGHMPLVPPGAAPRARGVGAARGGRPAGLRPLLRPAPRAGRPVLLLPPPLALAVAAGDLPPPALPARGARRLRRGAAGPRGLRHRLVQAGGGHHRERGGVRLPGRPRARPRPGPVPSPQLLPAGGAQPPLDLPPGRNLVDLAGDHHPPLLSYP